jgi:VanZ family protein
MIRWLAVGLWYAAIVFTSSLASTPDEGRPLLSYLMNKGGHVFVYAILGWLLSETLTSPRAGLSARRQVALAITIVTGFILASLDETRQTFVYGRTGQLSDVLLDTLSLSGGALLHYWLARAGGASLLTAPTADSTVQPTAEPPDERTAEHEHQQLHREHLAVAIDVRQERDHDRQVQSDEQPDRNSAKRTRAG